jgi:hypothetical protein
MMISYVEGQFFWLPSKVAGHIPARISDVPSWDAETIFYKF